MKALAAWHPPGIVLKALTIPGTYRSLFLRAHSMVRFACLKTFFRPREEKTEPIHFARADARGVRKAGRKKLVKQPLTEISGEQTDRAHAGALQKEKPHSRADVGKRANAETAEGSGTAIFFMLRPPLQPRTRRTSPEQ